MPCAPFLLLFLCWSLVAAVGPCINPNVDFRTNVIKFCWSSSFKNDSADVFATLDTDTWTKYNESLEGLRTKVDEAAARSGKKPDYETCFARQRDLLCATAFTHCNESLPCVGWCYNFHVACGSNETEMLEACGTLREPNSTLYSPTSCRDLYNLSGTRADDVTWITSLVVLSLFLLLCCPLFWCGNLPLIRCILCCVRFKERDPSPGKKLRFFTCQQWKGIILSLFKYTIPFAVFWIYVTLSALIPWSIESRFEQEQAALQNITLTDPRWTYANSFYYMFQINAALGFGEFIPSTMNTKVFAMFANYLGHAAFLSSMVIYSEPLFAAYTLVLAWICKAINWIYYTYISFYIQKLTKRKETENVTIRFRATFRIVILIIGFIIFHLIFAGLACAAEPQWDYGLAIYWITLLSTSVAFGDFVPSGTGGRAVFMITSIVGFLYFAVVIRAIQRYFIEKPRLQLEKGIKTVTKINVELEKTLLNEEEIEQKIEPKSPLILIRDKMIKWFFKNVSLLLYCFMYLFLIFILPLPIYFIENANERMKFGDVIQWNYLGYCYFMYAAVTGVGYGDYVPSIPITRAYLVFTLHCLTLYHYYLVIVLHMPLYHYFDKFSKWIVGLCTKRLQNPTLAKVVSKLNEYLIIPLVKIAFGTILFVIHNLISAAIIMSIEGWSYPAAYYWAYMTISTVGMVDEITVTNGGKVYAIACLITGISFFLIVQRFIVELVYLSPYNLLAAALGINNEDPDTK